MKRHAPEAVPSTGLSSHLPTRSVPFPFEGCLTMAIVRTSTVPFTRPVSEPHDKEASRNGTGTVPFIASDQK